MIYFVRKYRFSSHYKHEYYYDVIYAPSNRLYMYDDNTLPETVKRFMRGKTPRITYDKLYKHFEFVYQ